MVWRGLAPVSFLGIPVPRGGTVVSSTLFLRVTGELRRKFLTRKIESMKKIILYIAASIDGRIAEPKDGTEFLSGYPITEAMDYGYKEFYNSIDTIVMGGRSWREMDAMDAMGSYKDKTVYVVSRNDWGTKGNIKFITDNVADRIAALRNEAGKDIWLFGGGELVSMLLAVGLVDEMQITYIPVILGKGIPLFPEQHTESKWELVKSKTYENNVFQVKYRKRHR